MSWNWLSLSGGEQLLYDLEDKSRVLVAEQKSEGLGPLGTLPLCFQSWAACHLFSDEVK